MKKFPEIIINDLYSFTKPNQQQWMNKPGDVHYKTLGKDAQAMRLLKSFLRYSPNKISLRMQTRRHFKS